MRNERPPNQAAVRIFSLPNSLNRRQLVRDVSVNDFSNESSASATCKAPEASDPACVR